MVWVDGELYRPTMCKHQAGALLQFCWRSFVVPRLSLAPGPGDSFSEPVQSGTWCHVPSPHNYYRNACRHLVIYVSFPRASPVPTGQLKCRDVGVVMSGLSPLLQAVLKARSMRGHYVCGRSFQGNCLLIHEVCGACSLSWVSA